jgi:hypothetical protein
MYALRDVLITPPADPAIARVMNISHKVFEKHWMMVDLYMLA